MKHLHLVLSSSLVAFLATFSIASAHCGSCESDEPVSITITKAGSKTAKVTMESKTYSAPISFGEGASWDSVKRSYTVPGAYDELIEQGKVAISIEADGGAAFRVIKSGHKPAKKK